MIDALSVARALCLALDATGAFRVTYPYPPAAAEGGSAVVVMTGGEFDSYCSPALSFAVDLLSPVNHWAPAMEWLLGAVEAVRSAIDADPRLGGACLGVSVREWGHVERLDLGNGVDGLGLRVTLSPTTPTTGGA